MTQFDYSTFPVRLNIICAYITTKSNFKLQPLQNDTNFFLRTIYDSIRLFISPILNEVFFDMWKHLKSSIALHCVKCIIAVKSWKAFALMLFLYCRMLYLHFRSHHQNNHTNERSTLVGWKLSWTLGRLFTIFSTSNVRCESNISAQINFRMSGTQVFVTVKWGPLNSWHLQVL